MLQRRQALLVLQLFVACGALIYVLWLVDWQRASVVLLQADIRWLIAAFGLFLFAFVPAALRWNIILKGMGVHYKKTVAYRAYLTGTFYGLAMPGVIGGDAVRIWLCLRQNRAHVALIAGSVLAERALGVVALLFILSLGISLYPMTGNSMNFAWAPALAMLLLIGIIVFPFILKRLPCPSPIKETGRRWNMRSFLDRVLSALAPAKTLSAGHLLTALGLSIVFQGFDILSTFAIGRALGFDLSMQMLFIAMPIVYLATVLPISPGGLGVREGTLVIVLAQFGLPASDAALLALAVFLNRVAVGIVGALQHMMSGVKISTKEIKSY